MQSLANHLVEADTGTTCGTILGEAGVGKSSLAAMFPAPIFIRTEDGTASLGNDGVPMPQLLRVAQSSQEVIEQINLIATTEHELKTLVIDSVTKLNILIEQEIVMGDPYAKSINTAMGGYGAGHSALSERHRTIKLYCDRLRQCRRMNIVFIAHVDTELIEPPDEDAYTRYTLRMHKKSLPHYVDDVSFVAFIKLKTVTYTTKGERTKANSDGTRILVCHPVPNNLSKNQYGIDHELVFDKGENPLAPYIPALQTR